MFLFNDDHSTGKVAHVSFLLVMANVLVFILTRYVWDFELSINDYGIVPVRIDWTAPNSLYPFLTAIFLHGGFWHLFSNMSYLCVFGETVEEDLGKVQFFVFYLLGGVVAAFALYVIAMDSLIPQIGASGAISAVLGYYLILFSHHRIKFALPFINHTELFSLSSQHLLFSWFVIQVLQAIFLTSSTVYTGGVAYLAHVTGFMFGMIVAKLHQHFFMNNWK